MRSTSSSDGPVTRQARHRLRYLGASAIALLVFLVAGTFPWAGMSAFAGVPVQLSQPSSATSASLSQPQSVAAPGTGPFGMGISSISAGLYHTCGVKTDGTAACWGDNAYGQLNAPAGVTFTSIR